VTRPDRRSTPAAPLTPRQAELLTFIYAMIEHQGRRPTFVEMLDHLGVSRNKFTVVGYMGALEKKGYLRRHPNRGRGRPISPFTLLRLPDGSPFLGFLPISRGPPNDTDRNPDQP
jgi:SOS-response transcriptional repressor LexA